MSLTIDPHELTIVSHNMLPLPNLVSLIQTPKFLFDKSWVTSKNLITLLGLVI